MNCTDGLTRELYRRISDLWIIDAHEHLPPETERLALDVDAVSLFENYPRFDLKAAGMSEAEYSIMKDRGVPLDQRWKLLNQYLPLIRQCSQTRTTLLAVRELYGYDDVTSENYVDLTETMRAANQPGIYRRVFHDCCHVVVALNQVSAQALRADRDPRHFCIPQLSEGNFNIGLGLQPLDLIESNLGRAVSCLDTYREAVFDLLGVYRARGVVGIKLVDNPTIQSHPPDHDLVPLFERVIRFRDSYPTHELPLTKREQIVLRDGIAHWIIRAAGDLGLVIIEHSGCRGEWNDYRVANPTTMVPVFAEYPQVRFQVYHAGMPWVREVAMLAKAFPNVWVNLCWAHSLSSQMTRSALDEMLDLMPANKIIAWGGDTQRWVEWPVGDLVQARENFAAVLARRIREGLLNEEQAVDLAELIFYQSPRSLFRLDCEPPGDYVYA